MGGGVLEEAHANFLADDLCADVILAQKAQSHLAIEEGIAL